MKPTLQEKELERFENMTIRMYTYYFINFIMIPTFHLNLFIRHTFGQQQRRHELILSLSSVFYTRCAIFFSIERSTFHFGLTVYAIL